MPTPEEKKKPTEEEVDEYWEVLPLDPRAKDPKYWEELRAKDKAEKEKQENND